MSTLVGLAIWGLVITTIIAFASYVWRAAWVILGK